MSTLEDRTIIISGGIIYQELTLPEMTLRQHYFGRDGIQLDNILNTIQARDHIQVCPGNLRVIVSRDNVYYRVYQMNREGFEEFDALMRESEFKPEANNVD